MSLINDVLRDLDRRGATGPTAPGVMRMARRRRLEPMWVVAALVGVALLVGLGRWLPGGGTEGPADGVAPAAGVPAVSARPPQESPAGLNEPRWQEAPTLTRIVVEGDRDRVRFRFEIAGALAHDPRPVRRGEELLLVLKGTRVDTAFQPTDVSLGEAPWLRSLTLHEIDEDLIFRALTSDDVSVRTGVVRTSAGSRVALELSRDFGPPQSLAPMPLPPLDVPLPPEVSAVPPGLETDSEDAPPARVEKKLRPASAFQRADTAYRDGLRAVSSGGTEEALAAFDRALAELPSHPGAREARILALLSLGRVNPARVDLEMALRERPGNTRLARLLARILAERGESRVALDVLERAAPPLVEDPAHHAFMAAMMQGLGRHADAASLYRRVLGVDRGRATAWMGLAISLEATGDSRQALIAYRAALKVGGLDEAPARYVAKRVRLLEGS